MALTKARLLNHDFPVHGNAFSDSIAKLFRACFPGGIAQVSRDMLQNGVSL